MTIPITQEELKSEKEYHHPNFYEETLASRDALIAEWEPIVREFAQGSCDCMSGDECTNLYARKSLERFDAKTK